MNTASQVFVGLGANLGDAAATLEAVIRELSRLPATTLVARSSLYKSEPLDAPGPPYLNAVVQLASTLAPEQLLERLLAIEVAHGRERPFRNAPRTLDLDLLLVGDLVLNTPSLVLPHPRLQHRAFVLLPLLEIAPALHAPGLGALHDALPAVANQPIRRLP